MHHTLVRVSATIAPGDEILVDWPLNLQRLVYVQDVDGLPRWECEGDSLW